MNRFDFLKTMAAIPLSGAIHQLSHLHKYVENAPHSEKMPALFVGHGSPMNAIEDNRFSREMKTVGKGLPKPTAILMVSAHWETKGTFVTGQDLPPTIHDFGGFPQALFDAQYPAPGSKWLADETIAQVKGTSISKNNDWGFDHGCWSVTKNMFPNADIPIIQLSLDYTKPAAYHYALAKELASLREKGVLIIGSGNLVHNFQYAQFKGDFNETFGLDWAIEANTLFKKLITEGNYQALVDYQKLGSAVLKAAPTPEHYLPLLYVLALSGKHDEISFFNDVLVGGSFSMISLLMK
jgi:4,5-DOPA dioxygenase extradiol